jgi:hypothetical protein
MFVSLAMMMMTMTMIASGLLWLSELIEEHSKIAKAIGKRCIFVRLSLLSRRVDRAHAQLIFRPRSSSRYTSCWHSQMPCPLTRSRSPYSATLYTCRISPTHGHSSPFPLHHSSRPASLSSSTISCGSSISHVLHTRRVRWRVRRIAAGPW